MQVSGTFPQLSDGRKKSKSAKRTPSRRSTPVEPVEDGRGYTKHQPRRINAPKTTVERRELAHRKAAKTIKGAC